MKDILLEYMEQGSVKPGERISLPELAKELEVSATPLREALTQLTETGLVTYIANRGFFVSSLHEQEAIEIYELIAILESQAVLATDFLISDLKELEIINAQFKTAQDSISKLRTDRLFHQKLIQNYSNQTAKK
ncbi:MAG: GntR family transcriptional regulator, partial [Bacteroidota bacterium]